MASAQDAYGYPNTRRPPAGATYRQDGRGRVISAYPQGDIRPARPRLGNDPRNRLNAYGSTNPYQNRTQQAQYSWLGSGFPHPLPQVPPQAPPAPSFNPIQPGGARPSWDLAGISALLGPYWHLPISEDYNLNKKLREAIPLIDAAILRMKDLVGFPEIEAQPRLKRDITDFLTSMPVNRIQFGAPTWLRSHLDNAYTYGRAHSEIVLTADRRDVFGLVEVHPTTTGLRPTFDGYAVNVVQYQFGGGVPITLVPELLLTSVHDFRGDDPNGTSLIGSLPFVSEILIKMFRAHGQLWERYGVPNYHVNWEPPTDWNDPQGQQTAKILAPMQQNLYQSDIDRANGKIRHFWTTGKVSVDVMGAAAEQLHFETTAKVFSEQITAKTGIPPFMLGLSWSTTERMSTSQAKLLTELIHANRMMIEPCLRQLIDLRQRLVGRTGRYELVWPEVSLIDLIDQARADLMEAQAEQIDLTNDEKKVRLGLMSVEEMAVAHRDDLNNVPLAKVREVLNGEEGLPQLPEELPELMPVAAGGDSSGGGAAERMGNAQPSDESTKTLDPFFERYAEADEETKRGFHAAMRIIEAGNGNGKH